MSKFSFFLLVLLVAALAAAPPAHAGSPYQSSEQPVARGVMFWSSTCGHCEYVIKNVLPPLQAEYGDQLEIVMIELVAQEDVDRLFQTATAFGIAQETVGVPFMIIGERVLIGSDQIPAELPVLIEAHLAAGGVDYPVVPALAPYLPLLSSVEEGSLPADQLDTTAADVSKGESPEELPTPGLNGMILAIAIMVGMSISVLYAVYALVKGVNSTDQGRPTWIDLLIPILSIIGLGVSGYLTYVETQAVSAVCGPIGDCNAVQSSSYARLFGVLPVGILGLIGFALILIAWLVQRLRDDKWGNYASIAIIGLALFGTLFSIYLTYLEVFVIEAVCMWCLSSAAIMTSIMLLGIRASQEALGGGDQGLKKRRLRMLKTQ
jgi:uncharacterized membrane protein/thiol-disulfide isomerase/thioredoxin